MCSDGLVYQYKARDRVFICDDLVVCKDLQIWFVGLWLIIFLLIPCVQVVD